MEMNTQQILEELKNNPKCQAYIAQFDPDSAQRFLESYASTKELLLKLGDDWRNSQPDNSIYFLGYAEAYYWQIAQKKLFNMQCLWRAEKLDLPVTISHEFGYWEDNIKTCPFLPDISEDEIETMLTYLQSTTFEHEDYEPQLWQAYGEFKDDTGIGAGDDYPDWYQAYDNVAGTAGLMALPDIRGLKEEKYLNAWRKEGGIPPIGEIDVSRIMWSGEKEVEEFIRNVEPYKILDFYRLYKSTSRRHEFNERLEDITEILNAEAGDVYIPEGKFPDAIFQAAHLLKVEKMKLLLPQVHQSHLERKAMGIGYEQAEPPEDYWLANEIKAHILEGRRLLGEPEDFDF